MEISNWIKEWAIVISAGATFILAIAAFLAIWQNRLLQNRERREGLLNEIIEWALEIIKRNTQADFSAVLQVKTTEDKYNFLLTQLTHLEMALDAMGGRNQYASKIGLKFGQNLQSAIDDLIEYLTVYIKVLNESQINIVAEFKKDPSSSRFLDRLDKGTKYAEQLTRLANKAVEEATKIKTRDIS